MNEPRLFPAYQHPGSGRTKSLAKLVPRLREAVDQWRREEYRGATETSAYLLRHWFESDHEVAGASWLYYWCQREAVETTIYLYEVLRAHRLYDLIREFGTGTGMLFDPSQDRWCRYVYKMATGSGKTKVMSLLIAWSFFNAVRENAAVANDYAKTFLVLAPNVIVYERLLQDFCASGRIFREDPVVPPEWKGLWQFEVVTRDEPSDRALGDGALFLTNIQQMYAPRHPGGPGAREPRALADVVGEPVTDADVSAGQQIRQALTRRDDLLVLNDEGHHLHNERLRWSETVEGLHDALLQRTGPSGGLMAQLDFSATPKYDNGALFNEIIVDYPITDAIRQDVVKRPQLVMLKNPTTYQSDDASERYRDKLVSGLRQYEELEVRLKGSGRRPLLFIMTEDTKSADEISAWIGTRDGYSADEVLLIHTNRRGDITETQSNGAMLNKLRRDAHAVDSEFSPYKVIISVLMLREGWDVRNVCVIVPLRPYSSASQILPEQTLGRGLRRMFPLGSGEMREQLLVIEHEAFLDFWVQAGIKGDEIPIVVSPESDFQQTAVTVLADPSRAPELEVAIPRLTSRLFHASVDLDELDVHQLDVYRIAMPLVGVAEEPIYYNIRDMDTWDEVEAGEIEREFPLSRVGFLNHICDLILKECSLKGVSDGFAKLAPKVQEYVEQVGFAGGALLDEPRALGALNNRQVTNMLLDVFVRGINQLSLREREVEDYSDPILASRTRPYVTRRPTVANPQRSLFNHVPGDSDLELSFARWLDRRADDVAAFIKNESAVGFRLEYLTEQGGLRHYYPDFVVRSTSGDMYVVETKGLETIEVPRKDERVRQWCRDATAMPPGRTWRYVKVMEATYSGGDGWSSLAQLATASRE